METNKGISRPLCWKKGLICSINGLTARFIIVSISSAIMDVSKLVRGNTVIDPLSANSHAM